MVNLRKYDNISFFTVKHLISAVLNFRGFNENDILTYFNFGIHAIPWSLDSKANFM